MNNETVINMYDKISKLTEEVASIRLQLIELRDGLVDTDEIVKQLDQEVEAISDAVFTAVSIEEIYS